MQIEHGKSVQAAKALHARFQNVNLQLLNKVSEINSHTMDLDSDEELETSDGVKNKDPGYLVIVTFSDSAVFFFFVRHILGN